MFVGFGMVGNGVDVGIGKIVLWEFFDGSSKDVLVCVGGVVMCVGCGGFVMSISFDVGDWCGLVRWYGILVCLECRNYVIGLIYVCCMLC